MKRMGFSREAAQESSPRRKPWVTWVEMTKPRRGEIKYRRSAYRRMPPPPEDSRVPEPATLELNPLELHHDVDIDQRFIPPKIRCP